ncbi:competence protein CoiA [Lactobacillus sp. PSON]|uniref:competence protein CoiA n=1 Tax=Lactobacillus sp. PSON TaxID=3455454 RepID=UPI00404197DD
MYAAILNDRLVLAKNEAYLVASGKKKINYEKYHCPRCKKQVILIISQKKTAFFKHFKLINNSLGEKEEHHSSKLLLKTALTAAGFNAQIEIPLAEGQLRADVLASPKLAFEVQCAPLSEKEFNHRHNLYKQINIQDIWIVGQRHYLKHKIKKAQLIFMRKNQLWQSYYLEIDSMNQLIRLKYNIVQEPITRVVYYQTQEFLLDEIGIRNFWKYKPKLKNYQLNSISQKEYLNQQIKQKSKMGLRIAEKLYKKQIPLNELPESLFTKWRRPGEKNTVEQYLDQT